MRGALLFLSAAALSAACGPYVSGGDDDQPHRAVIEEAERAGLNVYWLGDEFFAAPDQFDRIDASTALVGDTVQNVELHYYPENQDGYLDLRTYSRAAWDDRTETNPAQFSSIQRKLVQVDGEEAVLTTRWRSGRTQPSNLELALEKEDAVVVLFTGPLLSADGDQLNAIFDEQILIGLASQVRSYDE